MSEKLKKPQKLRARLPRGLEDRGPAAIAATRAMTETIRSVYERYGFEPVETPAMEYTDALGKFLPDQDRPNEGVFSFQDDDEQWISLRYDLTAPLARYVAENYQHLALPYRSYRSGYVFRNEKPGPGRFRQFMQFDADTVGSASPAADAEMCMMAADTMEALGIPRGQYVVKVNNRKVLDGVMESIGLGGDENAGRRLLVLRAIDKWDRLGMIGVQELLGKGRLDDSGDFTKGAELEAAHIQIVVTSMLVSTPKPINFDPVTIDEGTFLNQLKRDFSDNTVALAGANELSEIATLCRAAGYGEDRIRIDPSVVRGLEYYTGPVFEVELLLETKDEKGRPVRFGSVGGGGRYDGLVSRFMGQPVPATGFSIGVSRLQAALDLIHRDKPRQKIYGPVLVAVFGPEGVADAQKLTSMLRADNIRAEMYLGNAKHGIGQQLKYADKRNSPCAVIQGSDERANNQVLIRDLIAGSAPSDAADRDAHLKKQAEAQSAVPMEKFIQSVREVLKRHDVK